MGNGFLPCSLTDKHIIVRIVRDREEMRRHLGPPLAPVFGNHVGCVDGQTLVRVDNNAEQA